MKDKEKEYAYNTIAIFEKAYAKFEKINAIPLTEISYMHLKPCFDLMIDEGLAESTIRGYFALVKNTLNHAIKNYQIIKDNPIDINQYKFPVTEKKKKKKIRALTEFELNNLLSKLRWKRLFYMRVSWEMRYAVR